MPAHPATGDATPTGLVARCPLRPRPPPRPHRVAPRTRPNHRIERLLAEEDHARQRIDTIDQALVDLATERRTLLERYRDLQHQLRPRSPTTAAGDAARSDTRNPSPHRRRPDVAVGAGAAGDLPGVPAPQPSVTTLRQLHVLLHRAGYAIASAYPAKTLAEACETFSYE